MWKWKYNLVRRDSVCVFGTLLFCGHTREIVHIFLILKKKDQINNNFHGAEEVRPLRHAYLWVERSAHVSTQQVLTHTRRCQAQPTSRQQQRTQRREQDLFSDFIQIKIYCEPTKAYEFLHRIKISSSSYEIEMEICIYFVVDFERFFGICFFFSGLTIKSNADRMSEHKFNTFNPNLYYLFLRNLLWI